MTSDGRRGEERVGKEGGGDGESGRNPLYINLIPSL